MGKQIAIKLYNGKTIYLPDELKVDLDNFFYRVKTGSMDALFVIDGKEGSGKSFDARLIGAYGATFLGVPFGPKYINFTTTDYVDLSENGTKFQVNVLDESREALNSKRGMSSSNVGFTNWLSENRDKQQVHIIILPSIHDLDKYVSRWRMSFLIHALMKHKKNPNNGYMDIIRGYFDVYTRKAMQPHIENKQKNGYYSYPKYPKYRRKFKYVEPFTEAELKAYERKKADKRKEKYTEPQKKDKYKERFMKIVHHMNRVQKTSQREIAQVLGMSRTNLGKFITEIEKNVDK